MPTRRANRPVRESAQNLLLALDRPPMISVNEYNQRSLMHVRTATLEALEAIRSLLSTFDLPYRDLTSSHVEHFLVCRDGDEIVGRDELPKAIQETEEAARLCPSSATCMRKNVETSAGNPP